MSEYLEDNGYTESEKLRAMATSIRKDTIQGTPVLRFYIFVDLHDRHEKNFRPFKDLERDPLVSRLHFYGAWFRTLSINGLQRQSKASPKQQNIFYTDFPKL